MLAPALLVLGGLVLGALTIAVLRSVGLYPFAGWDGFSLGAYARVLRDPAFVRALGFSLFIATTSTLLSAGIGIAVALLLRQAFAGRAALSFLFQVTLTIPHLIGALGILYLVSQSGLIARLAYGAGLIDRPAAFPALVYDGLGIGIILQYVWKEAPFIALVVLARLQTLGADHESVARALGASPWQAFRHVLLPLILPAVLGAAALVFAFSFGAYEVPAILGPSSPATLPVLAYRRFTDVDLAARPEAMALAVIISCLSAALISVVYRSLAGQAGHR